MTQISTKILAVTELSTAWAGATLLDPPAGQTLGIFRSFVVVSGLVRG